MIIRLLTIGLCLISGITSAPRSIAKNGNNFQFIILHNNDMHARFEQTGVLSNKCSKADADANKCYGGFARVAHEVREYRKQAEDGKIPKVLYLNAGDTYTGTPWFSLYKDKIASDFLKILKPDAISLGNHEFDEGSENLAKFLNEIDFPVLAANLDLEKEPQLQTEYLKPSTVFTLDGRKIGIIGYLTPETKEVAIQNDVEFIDEVVALNKEAEKLKVEGVNIIIALGHSGYERDKEIAEQCPDIDLVIGGHSHTFLFTGQSPDIEKPLGDFPTWVTQPNGKKVPVVQAYAFTKYLGYLHLEFDDDGNLIEIDGTPILLNASIPRDPDVLALLETYRPGILELENDIVGITKVLLDGSCRRNECNLGNFLADAMVDWYAFKYESNEFWTDASIALLQGGGIRASIDHRSNNGEITKEDAATVLPFESKIEVVEVSGKALLEALEHSVHRFTDGEPRGEFLQLSGVQVVYDMNKPSGQRVVEAKVLCAKCAIPELQEINETEMYKIIMLDFLADGGDGFEMFKGKSVQKFDELDVDIFVEYIKKKSPIHPAVEWRITIKDFIDVEENVVGSTKVLLDGNCRQSECNLGNFITDAMVDWHATNYNDGEHWTDAAIAIIQGSRIKASIDSKMNNGRILKSEASNVFQPAFFNLNLVNFTGDELLKLLEHSVSTYGNINNLEFLQMSGIQVTFDVNKPVGQRVTDVKVLCAQCSVPELQTLQPTGHYKVIMQSILASGADGFGTVIGTKLNEDLGESDFNVFIEYLEKKSPVHPAVEWRITIKDFVDDNEVVGSTKVLLDSICTQNECNLGNFITDA
ncbi:CLUMA_CG009432, isoform B, partial [Clunio marinus]